MGICTKSTSAVFASLVVLSLQSGDVQLFDIGAGSLLETLPAHTGPVWGIDMSPDKVLCAHTPMTSL